MGMDERLQAVARVYEDAVAADEGELRQVRRRIYRVGTLKLLLFVAGVASAWWLSGQDAWVVVAVLVTLLAAFLVLVVRHDRLFRRRDFLEAEQEACRQELSALKGDYSCFDGGEDYADPSHLYTFDLDVFGGRSLFQCVNRTCTFFGRERLASWRMRHLDRKEEIEERQEAVRELAGQWRFRRLFRVNGLLYIGQPSDGKEVMEWLKGENYFSSKLFFRMLVAAVPAVNLLFLALGVAGVLSFSGLGMSFAFFVFASLLLQKRITVIQSSYDKRLAVLSVYVRLMKLVEAGRWQSALMKEAARRLQAAPEAVRRLSSLLDGLNQRNNLLASTVLNGLLFWELRKVMQIERWRSRYASMLPGWLDAVGQVDALCSLAAFAYNNPDYAWPEIASGAFVLEASRMGHPLMDRSRCVRNGVDVPSKPFFLIITGANMAGKSTYLRTIGVNYLLACIGAPVCAEWMKVYPAHLVTSLRTSDSLADNESYFFAELKRLKLIIDKLKAGEELFIILDEILKGTNSVDKQKGSLALIRQFMGLQATGVIATHDLMLGALAGHYPDHIRNFRFEADIMGDTLAFSYRLKEGVAQNMNACFLMARMGIVVDEAE